VVVAPRPAITRGGTGVVPSRSVAPADDQHDVVFTFWGGTWTDAHARAMYMAGDRLLGTLLTRDDIRNLVVANPFRSTPVQLVRRLTGRRPTPFFPGDPRRLLVEPRRLRRHDPTAARALQRAYAAYDSALEQAAHHIGARDPVVVTTNPFVAGFAPLRWASRVTFYVWDHWTTGLPLRRWWPAYEAAYEGVRRSSRGVVAVSQAIVDHIGPTGPHAVVPNGVVPEEWRSPAAPPPWFVGLPSPRILYTGVLDDRLDVGAVRQVAARFPSGTVVLLGPVGDAQTLEPLRGVPNVRIEPPVGRAELASVVHAAEACFMPHRRTTVTAPMSPLKLYEYLAGGRPVAATDLPPVRVIDPRIVTVGEGDNFGDGVATALARGPLADDERLAFIDANSWQRRHDELLRLAFRRETGVAAVTSSTGSRS